MFKHVLIPTDGSKLSEAAVRTGIQLAKEQGAQVTALFVMADYQALIYGSRAMIAYDATEFEKAPRPKPIRCCISLRSLPRQKACPSMLCV